MDFRDRISDVFRTLWAHKLRTALTMFGIGWGVVSIVLMVAAGEGLRVGQKKQMENLGKDIMIVFAGRSSMQAGGVRAGHRISWEDSDIAQVKAEAMAAQSIKTLIDPQDIAQLAVFLASDAAKSISGQVIGVDNDRHNA